jgi:GxxExxY protein
MNPKIYKDKVYQIIGAAMEVHRELNWGLLEPVYNEALHLDLLDRGIDNEREVAIECYYKHHLMEKHYQMDIVVGDIIIELKSVDDLYSAHRAQLFNYMRLLKCPCGILVNFLPKFAEIGRYFLNAETMEIIGADGKTIQFL